MIYFLCFEWGRYEGYYSNHKISRRFICVLIDGVNEMVNHGKKIITEGRFLGALLAPFAAWLEQTEIFLAIKGTCGRRVTRGEKGYYNNMGKIF